MGAEELPEAAIPHVLSFSEVKDMCRCACVSKAWAQYVRCEPFAAKIAPIRARAQMTEEEKEEIDQRLRTAVLEGRSEDLKIILANGADIEAMTISIGTPLMLAAVAGQLDAVKVLIAEGAGVNKTNRIRRTALMWAAQSGKSRIVKYLISSAGRGHADVIKILVEAGASLGVSNREKLSALEELLKEGRMGEVAQYLIQRGDSGAR